MNKNNCPQIFTKHLLQSPLSLRNIFNYEIVLTLKNSGEHPTSVLRISFSLPSVILLSTWTNISEKKTHHDGRYFLRSMLVNMMLKQTIRHPRSWFTDGFTEQLAKNRQMKKGESF